VGKWVVLVVWIGVLVVAYPLAGRLFATTNDNLVSYLSRGAESTRAEELKKQLSADSGQRVIVIYERDSGITDADHRTVRRDLDSLAREYTGNDERSARLTESRDGKAVVFGIDLPTVREREEGEETKAAVRNIRELVAPSATGGLRVEVGGPGGVLADQLESFSGLHTTVLVATVLVVAVLLLLIYRSPFLWLVPLVAVAAAAEGGQAVATLLARHTDLTVTSGSAFVLVVLIYGAGTDYALLLISRYREELRVHEDHHEALKQALRRSGPTIVASAGTVGIGLLCLLAASLNSNRALGPVGFGGIAFALLAMLTLLPALLAIFGRRIMWPAIPHAHTESRDRHRVFSAIGARLRRRPRVAWVGTAVVLGVLALGMTGMNYGLEEVDGFTDEPESVAAQEVLLAHYPPGTSRPVHVIARTGELREVLPVVERTPGVATAAVATSNDDIGQITATLTSRPDTPEEAATIERLRDRVHEVPGADAVVGGHSAILVDVAKSNTADAAVIIPLVLLVILVVLCLLLRSLLAPLLLIASVVLSFAAAFGIATVVFQQVFGYAGVDASLPLQAFVFLVALGVDYNIFLMSRVREESTVDGAGSAGRAGTVAGAGRALAVTGGVITSAGVVLAATFAVLTALPLVAWVEIGFLVAVGVLLDTLVVRSVLVPALAMDLGSRIWWPARMGEPALAPVRGR
jgi:RND superfamily putative drug exporter